jgi:hypothetical protein
MQTTIECQCGCGTLIKLEGRGFADPVSSKYSHYHAKRNGNVIGTFPAPLQVALEYAKCLMHTGKRNPKKAQEEEASNEGRGHDEHRSSRNRLYACHRRGVWTMATGLSRGPFHVSPAPLH